VQSVDRQPASRRAGLAGGLAGGLGILIAPAVVALSSGALQAIGGLLILGGGALIVMPVRGQRRPGLGALLAVFGLTILLAPLLAPMPAAARRTLAVTVLMAAWWMSEAIPIPATSLLPLALFPVLGILPAGATATAFANNNIFLFMGGFILALGIQRWGLHRRIALQIVRVVGTDPSRMVLGFMLATAFLSMWISNTATSLMMLPIALAVIASLRELGDGRGLEQFAPALLLGVAYSASIGGLATPIGTPPNISFLRILVILFPDAPRFTFGRWMLALLPLVVIFLPVAWLLLTRVLHRLPRQPIAAAESVIRDELARLGRMGRAERRMLFVFAATALLWIGRSDLQLGLLTIPGWAGLVERWIGAPFDAGYLHDATVAVTMALLTFLIPGEPDADGRPRRLMDWATAVKLPWGILLLFGGGFALASAFKETGLSRYLGEAFAGRVADLDPLLLVASCCLLLTFLTEVTSNTATTEVTLPVLGGAAGALGIHPLLLMFPATLSASCAFMLPIATPPNAIVFGSGKIQMRQMVRAGIVLNLVGVVLITVIFYFVSSHLLGIDLETVPPWATVH